MNSLLGTFHVNVGLLVAQVINFAIVFVVLYYFVIRPIMKVMKDRSKTIEKSLDDAKNVEKKLDEAEKKYNEILIQAKKESSEIVKLASERAEKEAQKREQQAREKIGKIVCQEKDIIRQEKENILKEIKLETSDLVVASLESILKQKINSSEDIALIKKTLK